MAYVEIEEPVAPHIVDDQIHLTLVDLDAERNRWLAESINRETLFHRRWDVSNPKIIKEVVTEALAVKSPRHYQATLREIHLPEVETQLVNLPGMGPEVLPAPEPVEAVAFTKPAVNWWIEVRVLDGPEGLSPFSFAWPGSDETSELSEGELWTVLLAVDWRGRVVLNEATSESLNARTPVILSKYRQLEFPVLDQEAPLRWWKLEARLLNRSLSE